MVSFKINQYVFNLPLFTNSFLQYAKKRHLNVFIHLQNRWTKIQERKHSNFFFYLHSRTALIIRFLKHLVLRVKTNLFTERRKKNQHYRLWKKRKTNERWRNSPQSKTDAINILQHRLGWNMIRIAPGWFLKLIIKMLFLCKKYS